MVAASDDFCEYYLAELAVELLNNGDRNSSAAEAINYLTYLAEVLNYPFAMAVLGVHFQYGKGVISNPKKAAKYFEMAAKRRRL